MCRLPLDRSGLSVEIGTGRRVLDCGVVGRWLLRSECGNHIQTLAAFGEQSGGAVATCAIKAAYGGHGLGRFRRFTFELSQDVHVAAQFRRGRKAMPLIRKIIFDHVGEMLCGCLVVASVVVERAESEMTHVGSSCIAPEGVAVWNPAFDVTPARLITAIITEAGIARSPFTASLASLRAKAEGSLW